MITTMDVSCVVRVGVSSVVQVFITNSPAAMVQFTRQINILHIVYVRYIFSTINNINIIYFNEQ